MRKRIVVLVSGMDSIVAYEMAKKKFPGHEVIGVYYNLGQPFSNDEERSLPADIRVAHFRGYIDMLEQTEVQGYTFYPDLYEGILYDALRQYRPDVLWLGVLASDSSGFSDNTLGWIDSFSSKFPNVEIDYPLARAGLGKAEAVKYGLKLGLHPDVFTKIHHCRSKFHGKHGCGSCFSCMRKKSILEETGIETKIPSPKQLPTHLLVYHIRKYADEHRDGIVSPDYKYLEEAMPLLEKTYEVEGDVFALEAAIVDHYEANKFKVEELMEEYDD